MSIIEKITATLNVPILEALALSENGFTWQVLPTLTIGIWVMPNNQDNGYLEHFLSLLIKEDNSTLLFAQAKLAELMAQDFCEFSNIKKQKALLHTYLAWQKNPGLPMGTAVQAKYLNAKSPQAANFEDWFKNVFELED